MGHRSLNLCALRYICASKAGLKALRAQVIGKGRTGLRLSVHNRDPGALGGKQLCRSRTAAAGTAGN
jgi:hypothetical protein